MPKIKLDDVDKLYDLSLELGMLTYLQGLMCYNHTDLAQDFEFAKNYAREVLFDKQAEVVCELRRLLEKDGFTQPLENK